MNAKKNKSPGRPRSFDVDQALETAIRLFQSRGYDSVGVAELVNELGIKPPSFYAAFGSKAGLLSQTIARYSASEANVFERARDEGGSVGEVLLRTLANAARLYPGDCEARGCLVLDGTRNSADAEARALAAKAQEAGCKAMRDFIATEAPETADRLARNMTIALAGMSAAARDGASAEDLRNFAATFGAAILADLEAGAT